MWLQGVRHDLATEQQQQINNLYSKITASLVAQMVKRLPAMQKTWVQSLGLED